MNKEVLKPEDLRIGNILHYKTSEGDILETAIDWQDLRWASDDIVQFNLVNSGIPLTEEWLLKFNAEKDDIVDEIDGVSFILFYVGDYIVEYWLRDNKFKFTDDCGLEVFLSYVHQLQNLYFALTGEELTITKN